VRAAGHARFARVDDLLDVSRATTVQDRSAGATGSILTTALPLDSAAADLAQRLRLRNKRGHFARPNRCGIVPPLERTARSTRLERRCHRQRESTGRAVQDRSAGASGSILATALPLDSAAADLAHGRLRDQPDRALRAWLADDLMAAPARVACTAIGSQRSTTSVQLCGRFVPGLATNSIRFARCDAPRGWRAFIGTRVRPSGRAG